MFNVPLGLVPGPGGPAGCCTENEDVWAPLLMQWASGVSGGARVVRIGDSVGRGGMPCI